MKDYTEFTNEKLVELVSQGEEAAYEQLFANLKPITVREAKVYIGKMVTYDLDDFIQEGMLVAWTIISRENFKKGNFASYYATAIRFRLRNIYRDYCLKNPIVLAESADEKGEGYNKAILAEAAFAEAYREKHRRQCRESYARKKAREAEARKTAGLPEPEPRQKLTEEEKRERRNARSLAYYHVHKEELNAKRKAKREAEKKTK